MILITYPLPATVALIAGYFKNLRSERQWLEEDNHIQREKLETSQKNLTDLAKDRNS